LKNTGQLNSPANQNPLAIDVPVTALKKLKEIFKALRKQYEELSRSYDELEAKNKAVVGGA
jgi:hypothetical protein